MGAGGGGDGEGEGAGDGVGVGVGPGVGLGVGGVGVGNGLGPGKGCCDGPRSQSLERQPPSHSPPSHSTAREHGVVVGGVARTDAPTATAGTANAMTTSANTRGAWTVRPPDLATALSRDFITTSCRGPWCTGRAGPAPRKSAAHDRSCSQKRATIVATTYKINAVAHRPARTRMCSRQAQ